MTRSPRSREPLSSFILTVGAADMVIGGVGDRASLFLLGLATAGVGLLIRWARLAQQRPLILKQPSEPALKILPASRSSSSSSASTRHRGHRIY